MRADLHMTATVTLMSAINPSPFAVSVLFSVSVVSDDLINFPGPPTGSVEFFDGATSLGIRALDGSGDTSISISSLNVADSPHSITAQYSGDGTFDPNTSNTVLQVVEKSSVTCDVQSSTLWAPIIPGATGPSTSVTYTASLTTVAGSPTGTVTFKFDGTTIGIVAVASNEASITLNYSDSPIPALVTIGTSVITAEYSGDDNYETASGTHDQIVGYETTISFGFLLLPVTLAGDPVMHPTQTVDLGAVVNLVAAVGVDSPIVGWQWTIAGATGTMTFREGSTILGVVAVDAASSKAQLTLLLPSGTHYISADYSGDALFWAGSTDADTRFRGTVTVRVPFPPDQGGGGENPGGGGETPSGPSFEVINGQLVPCEGCGAAVDCDPEDDYIYTLTGDPVFPYILLCPPDETCDSARIVLDCCGHLISRDTSGLTPAQLSAAVSSMFQQCQQYQNQCPNPPVDDGGPGNPINPRKLYFNTPQTCTVPCP